MTRRRKRCPSSSGRMVSGAPMMSSASQPRPPTSGRPARRVSSARVTSASSPRRARRPLYSIVTTSRAGSPVALRASSRTGTRPCSRARCGTRTPRPTVSRPSVARTRKAGPPSVASSVPIQAQVRKKDGSASASSARQDGSSAATSVSGSTFSVCGGQKTGWNSGVIPAAYAPASVGVCLQACRAAPQPTARIGLGVGTRASRGCRRARGRRSWPERWSGPRSCSGRP